jgi:KAP family P-loop domain/Putative peptidoglycan binding domain
MERAMADVPEKTPDSLREDETAQTIKPPRVESGVRFGSPKVTEVTAETYAMDGAVEQDQPGTVSAGLDAVITDPWISKLQEALTQAGFSVTVDGLMGPQTQKALRDFQREMGLEPSGEPDPATIEALRLASKGDEAPEPGEDTSGTATGDIAIGLFGDIEGKAVPIEQLLALKTEGGSNRFSDEVRDLLHQAREYPHLECDGVPVIDAASYLRAALLAGESRGARSEHSLVKALSARDLTLDEVRSVRWPEKLEGHTSIPAEHRSGGLAGPDMTRILANAVRFAQRTDPHGATIFGRHAMAALIQSDEGRAAAADLQLIGDDAKAFFEAIHKAFLEHVKEVSLGEDPAVWDSILSDFPSDLPEWAKRKEIRRLNPSYDTDETVSLEHDRLGMRRDVEALADLICLKAAKPPLAIGLFGDWGSGKSTFMGMLSEAIDRATTDDAHTADLFVKNVAHIRFNAWHYVDSTLWASLITHLFTELDRQARDEEHSWLTKKQMEKLFRDELKLVQKEEENARAEREEVDKKIATAKEQLSEIEKERAKANKELAGIYAKAIVDSIQVPESVKSEAKKALTDLGLGDVEPSARMIKQTVDEAMTLGGRLKLLATTLGRPDRKALKFLGFGLLVFGVVAGAAAVLAAFVPNTSELVSGVGAVLGVVAGAAAWLKPHLEFINQQLTPLINAHNTVVTREAEAERERAEKQAEMQGQLEDLRVKQLQGQRDLEDAIARRRRLEELARGDRPAEMLARFIQDRAQAEDYRQHLGLLSYIRQDFQTMSQLMSRQRNPTDQEPRIPDLPHIDRIVLYIDDLDRCRHEQVVKMLEAVHLLLAFDLFVVVVGVDERWLRQSLVQAYPDQLANKDNGSEPRASPADYLGKIFQIPIWLQPLSFGEQGNYPALLRDLIGDEVMTTAESPGPEPEPPEGKDDGDESTRLTPLDITMPPHKQPSEETRERVTITDKEFKLMTKLGPLIGRSPRAVKRFVNLYRLYRAGLSVEERDQLVNDGSPRYPLVMFWLAAETGLDVEQMILLSWNLSGMKDEALDWNDKKLTSGLTDWDRTVVSDAIWAAVELVRGHATANELRKVGDEMSRYSFRPRVRIGGGQSDLP